MKPSEPVERAASSAAEAAATPRAEPPPRGAWREPAGSGRRVALSVALAYAALLGLGAWSIDFGHHWDESLFAEQVARTATTGVPLPGRYAYPSVTYAFALLGALPTWIAERDALASGEALMASDFLLHARFLVYACAYLALFWTARIVFECTRRWAPSVFAALALAFSFEFHYHARWLAPDALMAQFAVLATAAALAWLQRGRARDFALAVLGASLAAGTKYPGALALLPLLAAILVRAGLRPAARAGQSALACALFALGFLATTPGALLEPELFRAWIEKELLHYARGHMSFTVMPGWDHAARALVYLATQAGSPARVPALLIAGLALAGVVRLFARDARQGIVVFVLPWIYVLYFVQQKVLVVRNLQLAVPFVCLFAAIGAEGLLCARRPLTRLALSAPLAAVLLYNFIWLARADASVARRAERDMAPAVAAFVERSRAPVFLTPQLALLLGERAEGLRAEGKLAADPSSAELAMFVSGEQNVRNPAAVVANWPGIYRALPGSLREVNWDYYPTWSGDPRPLVIDAAYYERLFLPLRR